MLRVNWNLTPITPPDRAALVAKALSFRMTAPYGKAFERSDAYEE